MAPPPGCVLHLRSCVPGASCPSQGVSGPSSPRRSQLSPPAATAVSFRRKGGSGRHLLVPQPGWADRGNSSVPLGQIRACTSAREMHVCLLGPPGGFTRTFLTLRRLGRGWQGLRGPRPSHRPSVRAQPWWSAPCKWGEEQEGPGGLQPWQLLRAAAVAPRVPSSQLSPGTDGCARAVTWGRHLPSRPRALSVTQKELGREATQRGSEHHGPVSQSWVGGGVLAPLPPVLVPWGKHFLPQGLSFPAL